MKNKIKPFKSEELAYLCNQLSLILRSGISLNDGLVILLDDVEDSYSSEIITQLSESVNNQKSLYASMEDVGVFPQYMISMVKIGESSGHLENVLSGLSEHYLREANLKTSVKSAVLHPVILLVIMSAVIAVLIVKVLPVFKDAFIQIGAQYSSATSNAVKFASNAGMIVLIIIGCILALSLILFAISYSKKGKKFLYSLFSKMFFLKGLSEKMSIAKFASATYLMISSGFDNAESLSLSKEVVSNPKIKSKVIECEEKVANHETFSNAIIESKIFPSLYSQMIKISYKSGAIDDVWHQIADKYDDDVNSYLDNLVSFIQPIMVGFLTIIIGIILISVLLPLMGIMTAIS